MIISHDFKIELLEYANREIDNEFPVFDRCHICDCLAHGNVYKNGYYVRYGKTMGMAEPVKLLIRRLRCKMCKGSFSILPNFLVPYFQASIQSILSIVKAALQSKKSSDSRQKTWFYKKRYMRSINWTYTFFNLTIEPFDRPKGNLEAACLCLAKILTMGASNFLMASWNHMNTYFLSP